MAEIDLSSIEAYVMHEPSESFPGGWRRPFWLALLVAASVAFSLGFACAMPFAAICAAAACTLPRRDAYTLAGAVWLVNQGIGFAFLHYPWTAECLAWGAALGLVAFLCILVSRSVVLRLHTTAPVVRNIVAFAAALVAYEAALIVFSLGLGGTENFTVAIQTRIFVLNAVALAGLFALHRAGVFLGLATSAPSLGR
jgi:hypothetical protein